MITKSFRIKGMHCVNCAMRLQTLEDDLPGVQEVDASYRKGTLVVKFDEKQTNLELIVLAVQQLGYAAEPID